MIMLALSFAMMLGMLGMVFDGGRIYFEKRHMQAAADAGAFAGVHELKRRNSNLVQAAARGDVLHNGYDEADADITVTVNNPPLAGAQAGNASFVEVIIEQTVPTTFMRVVNRAQSMVRVRSVGGMVLGGDPCLVALNETAQRAFRVSGSSTLEADCGLYSNSSAPNALNSPSAGGCITATWAGVVGQANGTCMTFSEGLDEGLAPIVDPLLTLDEPTGPFANGSRNNATNTYSPGQFNSGININNGTWTFEPGLYIITNGLRINGGTIRGTGVTFYIINSAGTQSKSVTITGGDVQLSAPTGALDPMRGILFFGSRSNPTWGNPGNQIVGGADSIFQGAIYFPNEHIDVAGNTATNNAWAMMIGDTIDFIGNSDNRFIRQPTDPTTAPPIFRVALVE
ncbi:MAG: pilus assembly protein TadG-related protein [Acidobacteria bacterium]|nr:pilus assembly protein TadG-related protein [Acidobacteriota bacterium]MDA1235860.1 pilus assembly protein TadG-related protein [Acidobacteriota bacterium]